MDNEKTGHYAATLASKFLKMEMPKTMTPELWNEMKTVFASALTQAPDKHPTEGLFKTGLGLFSDTQLAAAAYSSNNTPNTSKPRFGITFDIVEEYNKCQ
ncbi:MAG: hypothetical protein V4456_12520 [Bacteroidota bacterium]